jgi:hypothetical protein
MKDKNASHACLLRPSTLVPQADTCQPRRGRQHELTQQAQTMSLRSMAGTRASTCTNTASGRSLRRVGRRRRCWRHGWRVGWYPRTPPVTGAAAAAAAVLRRRALQHSPCCRGGWSLDLAWTARWPQGEKVPACGPVDRIITQVRAFKPRLLDSHARWGSRSSPLTAKWFPHQQCIPLDHHQARTWMRAMR